MYSRPDFARTLQFQFTPLREGRLDFQLTGLDIFNFNSRPSARGDDGTSVTPDVANISIHAPPRGATRRSSL